MVVWSDGTTSFAGAISTQGLRGGFIETSGHVFDFTGGSVNAGPAAPGCSIPVDLTINSTLAGTIATALNGGSNVTQLTSASGTGGNGDITVASGISWSTNATLTLSAYRNIAVNANITSSGGGGVVLRADNAGTGTGTVTFGGGQSRPRERSRSSTIRPAATRRSTPPNTLRRHRCFTAATSSAAPRSRRTCWSTLSIDLQNMNNNKAGTYALGRDIDAGITSSWNSGAGFQPIGAGTSFTGNLNGQGHTISGLFINRPSDQNVGLISYLAAGAAVSNVGVIGATITGHTTVGGIVGNNYGTVTNVYSSGSVTATSAGAGGLVGYNFQTLSNGYSNSTVSGPLYVGGAVGLNNIAAGPTAGSISQVYATGAVTGTGGSPSAIGGLVGYNGNSITQSYWDSYTTGQASGVGSGGSAGVTAVTSDPAQSAAANYAFKQSAYGSFSFPGTGSTGWYMVDGQTRPFGRWEYQTTITNAHQLQLMAMNLGASYTLAGNIDLGSSLAAVGGKYPGMWSSAGFVPIGNGTTKFTGAFDGQGRTIANLDDQSTDRRLRRIVRLYRVERNDQRHRPHWRQCERLDIHRHAGRLQRGDNHASLCHRSCYRQQRYRRRARRQQLGRHLAVLCSRDGHRERRRSLCRRAGRLERRSYPAVLFDRGGQQRRHQGRRAGRRQQRQCPAVLCDRRGERHQRCRRPGRLPHQHRQHCAILRGRRCERHEPGGWAGRHEQQ